MFLKLMWWAALYGAGGALGAGDELLAALAGARGGNALSVCVPPAPEPAPKPAPVPARCPAALWRGKWALARASCLESRDLSRARVLRDIDGLECDALEAIRRAVRSPDGVKAYLARGVQWTRVHPLWEDGWQEYDLAMVMMDRPFDWEDALANATTAIRLLEDFEPWITQMYIDHWKVEKTREPAPAPPRQGGALRTFLLSVVLPGAAFMGFFLFVTFCTGTHINAPYTNVDEDYQPPPWILHQYSLENKCFNNDKV